MTEENAKAKRLTHLALRSAQEIIDTFKAFGMIDRTALKAKLAIVMFEDVEGVRRAIEMYKGPWKLKAMALAPQVEAAAAPLSVDTTQQVSSPTSNPTKSIKITWKNQPNPPVHEDVIQAFESFGIIDEVNFKDDKYAICTFQKDSDASYAVKNYKGGWRVKMSSKGTGGGGGTK